MKGLFSSFKLGEMTLKNRIVMSPMCQYSCYEEDGKVTDWHKIHYVTRAVGQVGLIIVEATAVTPQGRISKQDLGIWEDEHVEGLKEIVDLVHGNESKIGLQLSHAGRKADVDGSILAPSPIPFTADKKVPVEMNIDDIQATIKDFGEGARRANEAGFDVIELHAAHGYLINTFLSPLSNSRKDEYGGNRDNRFRFLEEVINEVKKVWSKLYS
ncbi:NADPH dehydrogenase [Halalkalibacter wakoensis JCM 9140]|uniref:NADPH dehydrogenase n=1 Tax=Halalkalibacter wakoensis JCM 9140 TaxID=1236970 RepID=W4Q8H0_9BACI|nr:NADPH dehydrogenase [Halalkalibacter wakoensis JCM 9140]